jgi:oligopeptidase B
MRPAYTEKVIYIRDLLRVTLIYKNSYKDKPRPCLLRGYGSYGVQEVASESPYFYPLLERGFVIAIAHVRGGGEYGYWGYDQGRYLNKKHTFEDFIETADYLVKSGITAHEKLAIWGRSAGGLLITTVLNMRPDLCNVAIVGVPFVAPIESLKTYKIPLGQESRSEFGNPLDKKVEVYMSSYAPLEHIDVDAKYPNTFIYTNLNDTLVSYKEPVAYYEAMRKVKAFETKERNLSFYLDKRFGHTQGTLLKDRCYHYALIIDYILKYMSTV